MDYLVMSAQANAIAVQLVKLDGLEPAEQRLEGSVLQRDIDDLFRNLTITLNSPRKRSARKAAPR